MRPLLITLTFFVTILCENCGSGQPQSQAKPNVVISNKNTVNFKWTRPLQVGDKIELSEGYDYDPIYLKNPPASKRDGTVIEFIKGQNEAPAAVVKLDQKISGERITGDIVVLELRLVGQTWQEPSPVHIELCNFMPENKAWKERKQGEWIEAAATVTLVQP
jgi:hypothetical protein